MKVEEKKVEIVKKQQTPSMSSLRKQMKSAKSIEECGAITSFTGIVRGLSKSGKKVRELHYECEEQVTLERLEMIRETLLEKYEDVKEILMYHVVDDLKPGDPILYVLVASGHRKQGFKAVEEAVEKVKEKVPIWKKEIRDDEAFWMHSGKEEGSEEDN